MAGLLVCCVDMLERRLFLMFIIGHLISSYHIIPIVRIIHDLGPNTFYYVMSKINATTLGSRGEARSKTRRIISDGKEPHSRRALEF